MTDEPGREGRETLPVPRPPAEPVDASRFSSPPQTRRFELTPARAAAIVTSSASARWVGFIATIVVVLFIIAYYFYELGLPLGMSTPRLAAEASAQAVTAVERGYNVYEANCARCHGPKGEGGIGPVLNDQVKLYWHLTPEFLKTILTVGGRYACGNADSLMPIWSDQGSPPGPLNYRQIEELIAFLRAPSDEEFIVRDHELFTPVIDPETGQIETFSGWVDPDYQPPPGATPFPDCYLGDGGAASPSPQPSLPPDVHTVDVVAEGIAFDITTMKAPANEQWAIAFDQRDTGVGGHDVDIEKQDGTVVADNPVLTDPGTTTYAIPPLEAGTYVFQCSVHPIPAMTGTLTVE
ncbi:MAG TPA: c-type cytochrome [Candidatus Limnocylindrales bacterium]|nr:c-type cytochrome [Candidatus Limnocylindrales bacterium]